MRVVNSYVVGQSLEVLEPFWVVVWGMMTNGDGDLVDPQLAIVKMVWWWLVWLC